MRFAALLLSFALAGCGAPQSTPAAGGPDRIVSLSGGITETVVELGLRDNLVGRDVSSDRPEVADVPVVTQGHDVSAEAVLQLAPSVVLLDARTGPPEAVAALREAGVAVVEIPEAWSLEQVPARVRAVAAAVDRRADGQTLVRTMNRQLTSLPRIPSAPRVAFLYLRGSAAVYLIGGDGSGADSLVEAVGGVDAGSEAGLGSFTPLTPEALAEAAPDVILVMSKGLESVGGVTGLLALPGVAQTPAGRDRRIVAIPDGELLNFGPRTSETLAELADRLT